MIENNPNNVCSAFGMLLEEIETEIDFVSGVGAKAFERRDDEKAKEALARSEALASAAPRHSNFRPMRHCPRFPPKTAL